ncbi:PASTA domain-containing protein [Herbidospora sp. NEAU-GS84]|uniref:PASTA domain-containing protein n=1 Tax=Herbidospora solisilvae TaxID=2696284 RepID=A0A7C9N1C1_9ACTN|nr:PASTA domain-containing protein [Herbidospora solisilvae]NAS21434.1 PASTA domain-containing protein [Herbidospora solisilvae]
MANQFGPPPHNPHPGFGPAQAGPHGYGAPVPEQPHGWAASPSVPPGQAPYYGQPMYPPPPPPPRKRKGPLAFIAAGLFVVLVACNALTDGNRVERSPGASAPRPTPITEEENAEPAESLSADQAAPTKAAKTRKAAAVEKLPLPSVVGMNLQLAQDTMQAAGFFLLRDRDATGQGRFQVNDRNWVVVRQVPAAGRKIDPATFVTLWAKKIGE